MSTAATTKSSRPKCKIAYIGGGSRHWARDLMKDLALKAHFDGEVVLYDIDHPAAEKNVEIGRAIFSRPEAKSRFRLRAVKSLAACLRGADFVVISIEPGPTECRYADLEIPLKYGVVQPVGDSTGPGGLLRALRAVPVYEGFAHAIMAYCPRAWVINYTNPMTLCTRTLYAVQPKIQAFGCCHEVFGSQWKLLMLAKEAFGFGEELQRDEIKVDVSGVNHFTWITRAVCRGQDLFPALRAKVADPDTFADATAFSRKNARAGKIFGSKGMVAQDLFRRFGALGAAGDRHLVEFVPWYARDLKTLHRWGVVCTPYAYRLARAKKADADVDHYNQSELNPTGEEGVRQMEALLGLGDFDTNVNLPNLGQAADLLPDAVVETNAAFRQDRVTPLTASPLPEGARCLVDRVVSVQEMILNAALDRDLQAALAALHCDPLIQLSPDRTEAMLAEMTDHIRTELRPHGY